MGAQVRTRVGRSLMPNSSTNTINRSSRWAFFKIGPSASSPAAHGIFVALDSTLFRLLRAKTQSAQNSPDMCPAEAHAVHALDDRTHAFDRPQLCAKSLAGRALQERCTHAAQLRRVKLGRPARLGYGAQSVDAALIKQHLACVHGLASHTYGQRHLRAALAFLQHPSGAQPLFCRLAQSLFHHDNHLLQ